MRIRQSAGAASIAGLLPARPLNWWSPALLPFLVFSWFAATAWIRPLAIPDEGRYVGVALEMLNSGNWLVPTLDGMPFFHKPPLFYWIAAASMQVFGVSEWAGRMPSLLAAAAMAWALFVFTRRWSSLGLAKRSVIVLACTPYFYLGSQYANMDMLVAACIGGCVLLAAHVVLSESEGKHARAALWGAYVMAAVGVLAKGLIGCVLPAAVLVAWLLISRKPQAILRLFSPVGLGLFLAVCVPWMAAMQWKYPGFLDYFIIEQHFRRFAGTGFNNAQAWWFYIPVLFVLALPWSLCVRALWKRARQPEPAQGPTPRVLMYCWLAVVVLFFSLPQSKLIGYILPAVPPLAWLIADAIAERGIRSVGKDHFRAFATGSAIVILVVIVSFAFRAPHSAKPIGEALAKQRGPGEPVVFVDTYPFDLGFYGRVRPTVAVVKQWRGSAVGGPDDWAKELFDQSRFDPLVASRVLLEEDALAPLLDRAPRTWVVVSHSRSLALPSQLHAEMVAQTQDLTLWRVSH